MANSTNNSPRQTHVSPGIYTKETDLNYAAKSLGITTLGVAGETVKGPAFQPILVDSWRTYQNYFGGTSTEKYRGSQYPKYELPYIAKSYLQESEQLQVCRVLGLSGTNAGAAWILAAYGDGDSVYTKDNPLVIGVLRSRGTHKKAAFIQSANGTTICEDQYEYDKLLYYATDVKVLKSKDLTLSGDCNPNFSKESKDIEMNVSNYGSFTLQVTPWEGPKVNYPVTLNPSDKSYILNVLGSDPAVGDSEIYVEELYDVAIKQLIERGDIKWLSFANDSEPYDLHTYKEVKIVPSHKPVYDILTEDESVLTRKYVGRRYLFTDESVNNENNNPLTVHTSSDKGKTWVKKEGEIGHIYTVIPYKTDSGTIKYYYAEYNGKDDVVEQLSDCTTFNNQNWDNTSKVFNDAVLVLADNTINVNKQGKIVPVTLDVNNYKEQYRYASTPWIVSELKGDADNVDLTKLFRFHTISDGNASNTEVKISITNIDPDKGTFDVLVRGFYDTDGSPQILERYSQCDLVPGSPRYIALLIGSTDESYETKSNYITVEVNETDKTRYSIPAGFLGYPVRNYNGNAVTDGEAPSGLIKPYFQYNTSVDDEIRINKQYFGISDLTGIDEDFLKYKGAEAYNDIPSGLTPCFHMDSRILNKEENTDNSQKVTVDGIEGYEWVTVGKENITDFGIEPRLGSEDVMLNTIYEDKRYRKFTVAFYGGWDGWDYYRDTRSNTDNFTYNKYRGNLDRVSGSGTSFDVIRDPENYGFEEDAKIITSDYYAYLSAIRQFANPKDIDINVLATPGIDYVNNLGLVQETIEMIEEERADSVYVVTTPDKPMGMGDGVTEMYTPSDVVANLDDSEIDSNYTCTYYPWVKYFDQDNSQYIYLPPTRDVVRNFAFTDNKTYPWFAAAGWNRGTINGIRSKKNLKLAEQDTLYEDRINFVNSFPDEGLKIWGDKNLQIRESQMNRISKRRLLLRIRKLIAIACIGLIFDPNDNSTAQAFRSAVSPILQDIVSKRGLIDFRIEVDDSQEARDRLELNAKIYLKLQPNLEYINIEFVITPSGVSFTDI